MHSASFSIDRQSRYFLNIMGSLSNIWSHNPFSDIFSLSSSFLLNNYLTIKSLKISFLLTLLSSELAIQPLTYPSNSAASLMVNLSPSICSYSGSKLAVKGAMFTSTSCKEVVPLICRLLRHENTMKSFNPEFCASSSAFLCLMILSTRDVNELNIEYNNSSSPCVPLAMYSIFALKVAASGVNYGTTNCSVMFFCSSTAPLACFFLPSSALACAVHILLTRPSAISFTCSNLGKLILPSSSTL